MSEPELSSHDPYADVYCSHQIIGPCAQCDDPAYQAWCDEIESDPSDVPDDQRPRYY